MTRRAGAQSRVRCRRCMTRPPGASGKGKCLIEAARLLRAVQELPEFYLVFVGRRSTELTLPTLRVRRRSRELTLPTLIVRSRCCMLKRHLITPHDQTSWGAAEEKCASPQQRDTVTYLERSLFDHNFDRKL